MPDKVTCTICGVTGPNSSGAIGAGTGGRAAPGTGAAASAGQRDAPLVRGGHVIPMDPGTGDIPGGDVLVSVGAIAAVGTGLAAPAGAAELDAAGMIVAPGLVDTHWHPWNTLLRGMSEGGPGYFPAVPQPGPGVRRRGRLPRHQRGPHHPGCRAHRPGRAAGPGRRYRPVAVSDAVSRAGRASVW